jgi:feruloyl esterase
VDYRNAAIQAAKDSSPNLADAVHLRIIPGMNHCAGGLGPDRFDGLGSLWRWRENGTLPSLALQHAGAH